LDRRPSRSPATPLSPLRAYHIAANISGSACTTETSEEDAHAAGRRYCWLERDFIHLGERDNCLPSLTCPRLPGKPCATYGLQLRSSGDNFAGVTQACRERSSITLPGGRLRRNEVLRAAVWFSNFTEDNLRLRCYLWCTEDGEMPETAGNRAAADESDTASLTEDDLRDLLEDFEMRSANVSDESTSDEVMSPQTALEIACNQTKQMDDSEVVRMARRFAWYGRGQCRAALSCAGLNEDTLFADHGLTVAKEGGEEVRVTREGAIYVTTLNTNEVLTLTLWYAVNVMNARDIRCYLWCQNVTSRARGDHLPRVRQDVLASLAGVERDVKNVFFAEENHMISPAEVYHLNHSSENMGEMVCNETCAHSTRMSWIWPGRTCNVAFTCHELAGRTCGDYWLQVRNGHSLLK